MVKIKNNRLKTILSYILIILGAMLAALYFNYFRSYASSIFS